MTPYENPFRTLRELKGAPLCVLLALCIADQPVTQEFLQQATGYTDKPVANALAYLQEVGLAVRTRQGWRVAPRARQLPLGLSLDEAVLPVAHPASFPQYGVSPASDPHYVESPDPATVSWAYLPLEYGDSAPVYAQEGVFPALQAGCAGSPGSLYGDSPDHATGPGVSAPGGDGFSPTVDPQYGDSPTPAQLINRLNNAPPDSPPPSGEELLINGHGPDEFEDEPADDDLEDIWEALLEAGVMRNARTEALVRLPHLSADYIRAHHARLVRMGKGHETGLLIYILESNQPSPDFRPNYRDPKRYSSWNE